MSELENTVIFGMPTQRRNTYGTTSGATNQQTEYFEMNRKRGEGEVTREQIIFLSDLFHDHQKKMAQIAYRKLGNEQIAEELVQEVFLAACVRIEKVYTHPKPVGWLYVTLNNLVMNELNKAYRNDVSLEEQEFLAAREITRPLEDSLPKELKPRERKIVLLRFEQQRSYKEIAEVLGLSQPACRKLLSRTLEQCRKYDKSL